MLFALLKSYARFALRIYCRRLVINKPEYLRLQGPVLFAANHPNSFLDGIILTTLLEGRLYALARGDAFNTRWGGLLRRLRLLPVYRTSEGIENLAHNYTTFSECHRAFAEGSQVLIFSEGRCVNEWHLRPLRKGTARLAISAWDKGIHLTVIPLAFNYSSFRSFGKNVHLLFGKPLQREAITAHAQEGKQFLYFNQQLEEQLRGLVYEINPDDTETKKRIFEAPVSLLKKLLLALPAAAGWLLHAPLYYAVRTIAGRFREDDHFDSIVVGLLLLLYPVYVLLLLLAAVPFTGWWAVLLAALLPFCAWACVQLKPQV